MDGAEGLTAASMMGTEVEVLGAFGENETWQVQDLTTHAGQLAYNSLATDNSGVDQNNNYDATNGR